MHLFIKKSPVITIDGPSGTGKGTIARKLARYLNWHVLDSGVIYRALAFVVKKQQLNLNDISSIVELAKNLQLNFEKTEYTTELIFNSINITQLIRSEECGQNASKIATFSQVREALLSLQRSFALPPGLVTDGRDMGSVVFPDAELKIYLTASIEERAKRRLQQLQAMGIDVSLCKVTDELTKRDLRDTQRQFAPLIKPVDALLIDTTRLTIVEVFEDILQLVSRM